MPLTSKALMQHRRLFGRGVEDSHDEWNGLISLA
jgi:hypothetical protein